MLVKDYYEQQFILVGLAPGVMGSGGRFVGDGDMEGGYGRKSPCKSLLA
jgi:hypothetical protein